MLGLSGLELRAGSANYVLGPLVGEGAHGVVFRAERRTAQESVTVVVKLLRPRALRDLQSLAGAAVEKEVAALRRLSKRETPNVVRFFDAGVVRLGGSSLELPWIAVEYVDGGEQGVTLRSRVEASLAQTGHAFDTARALRVLRDVTRGLSAIHALGMLHRDLAPGNVLCTGAGESERFKIADFGLARVSSVATFGNVLFGTPGYCAPEQSFPDKVGVGPYTDVFGLACTFFFALTGKPYFAAASIPESLVAVYAPERESLNHAPRLHPELQCRPETQAKIDRILSQATRPEARERIQSASLFAEGLVLVLSSP